MAGAWVRSRRGPPANVHEGRRLLQAPESHPGPLRRFGDERLPAGADFGGEGRNVDEARVARRQRRELHRPDRRRSPRIRRARERALPPLGEGAPALPRSRLRRRLRIGAGVCTRREGARATVHRRRLSLPVVPHRRPRRSVPDLRDAGSLRSRPPGQRDPRRLRRGRAVPLPAGQAGDGEGDRRADPGGTRPRDARPCDGGSEGARRGRPAPQPSLLEPGRPARCL